MIPPYQLFLTLYFCFIVSSASFAEDFQDRSVLCTVAREVLAQQQNLPQLTQKRLSEKLSLGLENHEYCDQNGGSCRKFEIGLSDYVNITNKRPIENNSTRLTGTYVGDSEISGCLIYSNGQVYQPDTSTDIRLNLKRNFKSIYFTNTEDVSGQDLTQNFPSLMSSDGLKNFSAHPTVPFQLPLNLQDTKDNFLTYYINRGLGKIAAGITYFTNTGPKQSVLRRHMSAPEEQITSIIVAHDPNTSIEYLNFVTLAPLAQDRVANYRIVSSQYSEVDGKQISEFLIDKYNSTLIDKPNMFTVLLKHNSDTAELDKFVQETQFLAISSGTLWKNTKQKIASSSITNNGLEGKIEVKKHIENKFHFNLPLPVELWVDSFSQFEAMVLFKLPSARENSILTLHVEN